MAVGLDGETFVTALIQMADADGAVGGVEPLGVELSDPSHKGGQIAVVSGPDQQVPVIAHQAIAAQTHGETLDAFGEDLLESPEIIVFAEDAKTAVGPIEHVIGVSAQRDSFASRHNRQ